MTIDDLRASLPDIELEDTAELDAVPAESAEKVGRHARPVPAFAVASESAVTSDPDFSFEFKEVPESEPAVAAVPVTIEVPERKRGSTAVKVITAVLVLALCGGGVAAGVQTGFIPLGQAKQSSSESAAATAPVEQPKQVTSKVDGALVFYAMGERGAKVDVTGEDDIYYQATYNGANILVEKKWVRLASEEQPAERIAYANDMVPLFKSAFLIGDPVASLPLNTEVTVVDEKDDWLFVKTDEGVTGYARATDFRTEDEKRAEDEAAAAAEEDEGWYEEEWYEEWYDYSDDYSYDDSGSSYVAPEPEPEPTPAPEPTPEPAPSPEPSTGGDDGGDIVLAGFNPSSKPFVETAYAAESSSAAAAKTYGKGVILSDGVTLYLAKLNRGEAVDQADAQAKGGDAVGTVLVKVDGIEGTITRALVSLEDDAPFKVVDAYTQEGAVIYRDYTLEDEERTCALNDVLHLVDEYGDNYVIEEKGVFFYTPMTSVSLTKIEEPEEPEAEEAEEESDGEEGEEEYWEPEYYEEYTEPYYEEPYYGDDSGNTYVEPEPAPAPEPEPEPEPAPEPEPEPTPSEPEPEWTEPVK